VVTGSAQRHVIEAFDKINLEMLRPSAAPEAGIPCVSVERAYEATQGRAIYTYTYEGTDVSYQFDDARDATFELDVTMSEDPIQTHPNFPALKKKYGWNAEKRQFLEVMPKADKPGGAFDSPLTIGGGLTGTLGNSKKKSTRSPLYGVTSYLAIGAVFTKTYARRAVPGNVLQGIGAIVGSPPGISAFEIPFPTGKRNWLKIAPRMRRRGNTIQISESWMLSGPNGWIRDIYSEAAILRGEGGGAL